MNNCPHCRQANQQIKAGHNQSGSQRYICKWCGKTYTPTPKQRGYPVIIRKQAIQLYQEGHSYRAVARQMGIGTQSVINWVKNNKQMAQMIDVNKLLHHPAMQSSMQKEHNNG